MTVGDNLNLSVTNTGGDVETITWYKDDSIIPDENSLSLNLTSVKTDDSGDYKVTLSNSGGSVTSGVCTVTVSSSIL